VLFDSAAVGAIVKEKGAVFHVDAVQAAGMDWDSDKAHSAVYDTERTADLFCAIVNRWHETSNNPGAVSSGVI